MRNKLRQIALAGMAILVGATAHAQDAKTTPSCKPRKELLSYQQSADASALKDLFNVVVCADGAGGIGKFPPNTDPVIYNVEKTHRYCEARFVSFTRAFEDFNKLLTVNYQRGSHEAYKTAFRAYERGLLAETSTPSPDDVDWQIVRNGLIRGGLIRPAIEEAARCHTDEREPINPFRKADETIAKTYYGYAFFLQRFAREAEMERICRLSQQWWRCDFRGANRNGPNRDDFNGLQSAFERKVRYHQASLGWLNRTMALDNDRFSGDSWFDYFSPTRPALERIGVSSKVPPRVYFKMAELVTSWALFDLLSPSAEWKPYSCVIQRLNELYLRLVSLNNGAVSGGATAEQIVEEATAPSPNGRYLDARCQADSPLTRADLNIVFDDIESIIYHMGLTARSATNITSCGFNKFSIFEQNRR